MKNIVLYGAGTRGERMCKLLEESGMNLLAILDASKKKIGTEFHGRIIEAPEMIKTYKKYTLCITIGDRELAKQARESLKAISSVTEAEEVSYNALMLESLRKNKKINKYVESLARPQGRNSYLFVCYDAMALGGIEEWTRTICSDLRDSGMNNVYILSDYDAAQSEDSLSDIVVRTRLPRTYSSDSIIDIMETIYRHMPCRVITIHADSFLIAAFLLKQKFPGLIDVISSVRGGSGFIYDAYMDFRICTDIYVGVSNDIKRELVQRGIPEQRVHTMTVPFYCEKRLKREYSLSKAMPLRIGYAGRLDGFQNSQKRMDLVLRLIEELATRNVIFAFTIAGDGNAREEMEKIIRERGHGEYVRFLGRLNKADIPCFWKQQDVCINMADLEGRSISIAEAMGHGAVPVVTDTSGVRDDILEGRNGFIVPIGDYQKAADKIAYLAANRYLLPQMGKLAHEVVYPTSLREPHLKFWQKLLSDKQ